MPSPACSGARSMRSALDEQPLGVECKPFSAELAPVALGELGGLGIALGDPRLLLPALLLDRGALAHNIGAMASYCAERGLLLAPHGKTTMAPQIFAAQLEAGAWGMTAATAGQAQVMRAFGVRRILLANELVDPGALAWVARELDGDVELLALVDSVAAVERMDRLLAGAPRPLDVLLEVGLHGRRAGVRSAGEAREVAAAVGRAAQLRLMGIECFEGVAGTVRDAEVIGQVDPLIERVAALAGELAFEAEEITLSAGGSMFFDRLGPLSGPGRRVIARSGCYVTHDSGLYERTSPLPLRPALELWGEVLSRPERELAIVGVGRRDAPFDAGLPMPQRRLAGSGGPSPLSGWATTELNDQHAFLHGGETELEVGDLVGFGISHPCTAFDKWRVIPVVEDLRVIGAVRTFF